MHVMEVERVWLEMRQVSGQKNSWEQEERRNKIRDRGREEFGGLKRVLAFPLEEVLMPYWMQLLMNRCAVCGHRDSGSASCMATHPIEVHQSWARRCRHQPPSGLK